MFLGRFHWQFAVNYFEEDVAGKTILHTASAGTQGTVNAAYASEIITGSIEFTGTRESLNMEVNYMKIPKMVLFDYGQTLIAEQKFDGVKGTEAVLRYATRNKYHLSAEQVQAKANEINRECGRFDPEKRHLFQIEIPNTMFMPYLYESLGIEIALSNSEIDRVFWDAAAPGVPTEGVQSFLRYLQEKNIRTGVISNISYAPSVVARRINRLLPDNAFEFIITSSNYIFRKPNKRLFELALEKADLKPDEVWYVGDQYECDIKGALGAGLMPVWYTGAIDLPYVEDKNILTIAGWEELKFRLGKL